MDIVPRDVYREIVQDNPGAGPIIVNAIARQVREWAENWAQNRQQRYSYRDYMNHKAEMLKHLKRDTPPTPPKEMKKTGKRKKGNKIFVKDNKKMKTGGRVTAPTSGIAGGFIKRGSKRYRKSRLYRTAVKSGINYTMETYKIVSGVDCVSVGHSTMPANQLYRIMWMAFWKFVVMRWTGQEIRDRDEKIVGLQQGSAIDFRGTIDNNAQTLVQYILPTGGTTLEKLVDWSMSTGRPWFNKPGWFHEYIELSSIDTGFIQPGFRFNVKDFRVRIVHKSSLKIQNTTLAQGGGANPESTAVTNVPLYGKTYEGRGNVPLYRGQTSRGAGVIRPLLSCDSNTGMAGRDMSDDIPEPPLPNTFSNVSKSGKVRIDPGQIKTSVLSSNLNAYFNTLHEMVFANPTQLEGTQPTPAPTLPYWQLYAIKRTEYKRGRYRFMLLEKMLNITNDDPIRVYIEVNSEMSASGYNRRSRGTVKFFDKQFVADSS